MSLYTLKDLWMGLSMLIEILIFVGLVAGAILAWIGNEFFHGQYLYQISLTLWTIAGAYLFVKVLSGKFLLRKIDDKLVRYSLNKVITILSAAVAIAIILHVWFGRCHQCRYCYSTPGCIQEFCRRNTHSHRKFVSRW
jgi:hypothetical protein